MCEKGSLVIPSFGAHSGVSRLDLVDDEATFGGKAAHLGRALRSGLPVPFGFALSTEIVEELVAPPNARSTSTPAVENAILEVGFPCAVRSSAVGEDSATASFAGQLATKLDVTTLESALSAIAEVHASGARASAYRDSIARGGESRTAVVIQRMIAPRVAGVLFTRDPVRGDDVLVVEANWGLAESVVAGLVTPDSFRLSPEGTLIESRLGEKDVMIVRAPGGGTMEVPVPPNDVSRACLETSELAGLVGLAASCVRHFGTALDLEWAIDAHGGLHLLQWRPITVLR